MTQLCPQCDSAHIVTKHTGKKTGSAIGTVAGMTARVSGAASGAKVGETLDGKLFDNHACLACGYTFRMPRE